jgi:N-acetyl-anhydromuramyl-L-alanine amidase AmpD
VKIEFSQRIVDTIRSRPGVPYPPGSRPTAPLPDRKVVAIVLHDANGPDNTVSALREGLPAVPGPLAHWAVRADGSIVCIANENKRANHIGRAIEGLSNDNTIGITATGAPAFQNDTQIENFVRLVADVADRWDVPTNLILSHAEVAVPAGRKNDMSQQAPVIRQMVEAVRRKHPQ